MCKYAVTKLPYLLRYAPDQYKTQQICKKAISVTSVPDCYRNHKMCNKAVDNYTHALEFVPQCYKTRRNVW